MSDHPAACELGLPDVRHVRLEHERVREAVFPHESLRGRCAGARGQGGRRPGHRATLEVEHGARVGKHARAWRKVPVRPLGRLVVGRGSAEKALFRLESDCDLREAGCVERGDAQARDEGRAHDHDGGDPPQPARSRHRDDCECGEDGEHRHQGDEKPRLLGTDEPGHAVRRDTRPHRQDDRAQRAEQQRQRGEEDEQR